MGFADRSAVLQTNLKREPISREKREVVAIVDKKTRSLLMNKKWKFKYRLKRRSFVSQLWPFWTAAILPCSHVQFTGPNEDRALVSEPKVQPRRRGKEAKQGRCQRETKRSVDGDSHWVRFRKIVASKHVRSDQTRIFSNLLLGKTCICNRHWILAV